MRTFYIFVKCRPGTAYEVASRLVDQIAATPPQVHSISGRFDLIAQFHLPSDVDIGRFVNEEIHPIDGIVDTETIICFNAFTKDEGLGETD